MFVDKISSAEILKDVVRQVMSNMFEQKQQLGEGKATIKQDRSINPVSYHFSLPSEEPYQHYMNHPDHDSHHEYPDHHHPDHHHVTRSPSLSPLKCRTLSAAQYLICVHVLKSVPELQCTPEAFRECNDFETKGPYLEEECEKIVVDEYFEVRY
jgi:hypothetical protein